MNPLKRLEPTAYALLRIVAGLLFACHGLQKLLGRWADIASRSRRFRAPPASSRPLEDCW